LEYAAMKFGRLAAAALLAGLFVSGAASSANAVLLSTTNFNGSGSLGGTISFGDIKFDIYCFSSPTVCNNVDINTTGSTSTAAKVTLTGSGGSVLSGSANSLQDVSFFLAAYTISGVAKITSLISSWTLSGGSEVLNGTIGSAITGSSPGNNSLATVALSLGTQTQTSSFAAQSVIGNCSICSAFDAHATSGNTVSSVSFTVGVPEPGTVGLVLAGIAGLAVRRRRIV
jgi:hypothetical protein